MQFGNEFPGMFVNDHNKGYLTLQAFCLICFEKWNIRKLCCGKSGFWAEALEILRRRPNSAQVEAENQGLSFLLEETIINSVMRLVTSDSKLWWKSIWRRHGHTRILKAYGKELTLQRSSVQTISFDRRWLLKNSLNFLLYQLNFQWRSFLKSVSQHFEHGNDYLLYNVLYLRG